MKKAFLILACLFAITDSFSQGLIIHKNDGSSSTFPIAEIDSITFSQTAGEIIFADDFESGDLSGYIIPIGDTPPVLTDTTSYSPTHSITLIAPRTSYSSMGMVLLEPATSNIFGISCRMMKSDLADMTQLYLAAFQGQQPNDNQIAIGFIQDSIYIANLSGSNPSENVFLKVDIIEANRWYLFSIEHNFDTHITSFFIDNIKIYEANLTLSSFDSFYFGDGDSGSWTELDKVLFIDDIKLYKR